jgi:poly-gamma-glutamate synthesis protein (capsule biosynthesis protein)
VGEERTSSTIEVVAVGDVSLGDSPQAVGTGVHARFEQVYRSRPTYPFEHAHQLFVGADVVFGNLETVLSHRGLSRWNASSLEMRGHPDAAGRLVRAGFGVLNVANNHMMQHGTAAFADTVNALREAGAGVAGIAAPDRRSCVPYTFPVNGLHVAVLGFAFERDKYAKGPVEYAFGPDCDIPAQVAQAKTQADVVICSVHWGVEFVRHPSIDEEVLGRQIIDAGADLVLGHHPHVVRRVERYRRGLIAYSLGNFIFDQLWNAALRTGLLLRVTLSRDGVTGYATELVWIADDFQPWPMAARQAAEERRDFDALHDRPEWVAVPDQYAREYATLVARNRYESYRHFVRTLRRRPVTYTLQTLLRTARRKATAALGIG